MFDLPLEEIIYLRKENLELRQVRQPDPGIVDPAIIERTENGAAEQGDDKPMRDLVTESFLQWFAQWGDRDELVAGWILDKVLGAALANDPEAVKAAVKRQFMEAGLLGTNVRKK